MSKYDDDKVSVTPDVGNRVSKPLCAACNAIAWQRPDGSWHCSACWIDILEAAVESEPELHPLTRALAESHAERDLLAEQLENIKAELDIHKHWVALDNDDRAVMVVGDVDHEEGSWCAVFRFRERAERFVELARADSSDAFEGANLAVLDGTVTAKGMNLWNSFEAVQRPVIPTDSIPTNWRPNCALCEGTGDVDGEPCNACLALA